MFSWPDVLCKTSDLTDGNMSFRFGNDETVVKNRRQFLTQHDITWDNHVCMACNNGAQISTIYRTNLCVGAESQAEMLETEVLVTRERGLALMVLTADCIPACFYDPVQKVIALAHLNRHTIRYDLAQKTVGFLGEEFGTKPTDILVYFAPHIHVESYRYPLPLTDKQPSPKQLTSFISEHGNFAHIDITAAHLFQLTGIGVLQEHISISTVDVATDPNYFSHWRSQHDPDHPTGRFATILMLS